MTRGLVVVGLVLVVAAGLLVAAPAVYHRLFCPLCIRHRQLKREAANPKPRRS